MPGGGPAGIVGDLGGQDTDTEGHPYILCTYIPVRGTVGCACDVAVED